MESTLENSDFKPPTSIRKSPFSTTLDPYIKELIFNKKYDRLLNYFCYIQDNELYVDSTIFRHVFCMSNDEIMQEIINNVDCLLNQQSLITIQINLNNLSFTSIEKMASFMLKNGQLFQTKYPNKVSQIYIYNIPSFYSQIYKIFSKVLDKPTQEKIIIIKNEN
jgi:hypothetical protein